MTGVFTTREIATGIWLIAFIVASLFSKRIRQSLWSVFRAATQWKISLAVLIVAIYAGAGVVGLWGRGL